MLREGAAPAVLDLAGTALSGGQVVLLDDSLKAKAEAGVERLEGEGQRVIAAADRDRSGS